MSSLAFVTPVHGRFGIAAVCMEQRLRVCLALEERGVQATVVVVGDDENADTAGELGFHVVRQGNNSGLGRKFNDGIEYACRELEVDYVVPIGSDDWVLPGYLNELPGPGVVHSGKYLSVVAPDGREIACMTHDFSRSINARGYIPWIIPRACLSATGYRPTYDARTRGLDADMGMGICRTQPRPEFKPVTFHPLQCVDFKNTYTQITPYQRTVDMNRGTKLIGDVWELLAEEYPLDLVERMQTIYTLGVTA